MCVCVCEFDLISKKKKCMKAIMKKKMHLDSSVTPRCREDQRE